MNTIETAELWKLASRPALVTWAIAQHDGQRSICPLGWFMRTSFAPPMVAVSIAPARFTHSLIAGSGEFVLAWPGADLAETTLYCGTHSARRVDKFTEMKLTTQAAKHVRAPLVAECPLQAECRVTGRFETGDHTMFVGQVLCVWKSDAAPHLLCSVNASSGSEVLLEKGGYSLGVIR